jgi:hypothetical protein
VCVWRGEGGWRETPPALRGMGEGDLGLELGHGGEGGVVGHGGLGGQGAGLDELLLQLARAVLLLELHLQQLVVVLLAHLRELALVPGVRARDRHLHLREHHLLGAQQAREHALHDVHLLLDGGDLGVELPRLLVGAPHPRLLPLDHLLGVLHRPRELQALRCVSGRHLRFLPLGILEVSLQLLEGSALSKRASLRAGGPCKPEGDLPVLRTRFPSPSDFVVMPRPGCSPVPSPFEKCRETFPRIGFLKSKPTLLLDDSFAFAVDVDTPCYNIT